MDTKRLISFLLAISMIISMLPMGVFATEGTVTDSEESKVVSDQSETTGETGSPVNLDDYTALELDVPATAEITTGGAYVYFTFTPELSCDYWFTSHADADTHGYLYDANMNELTYNDDSNGTNQFGINYYLEAGTTYILGVGFLDSALTGSFDVSVCHNGADLREEWVKESSCTEEGIVTYTCNSCGYAKTETVAPSHHNEVVEHVNPSCTEGGYDSYVCSLCGHESRQELSAYGHSYTKGICSVCDDVLVVSGTCGDDITWTLSGADGVLRLNGTGPMAEYSGSDEVPWRNHNYWVKSVEISEGITTVANCAFLGFSSLTSVSLPSTLTSIGSSAFNGASSLEQIVLPEGVTELGFFAFVYCYSLNNVSLPSTLKTIMGSAFQDCYALEEITLPEGLETIGSQAFLSSGLKSVVIPATVTQLFACAFDKCNSLQEIQVAEGNQRYSVVDGLVYEDSTILHIIPGTKRVVTVPAGVTCVQANIYTTLQAMVFQGDAPDYWYGSIENPSKLNVYYPADNGTWSSYAISNLGTGASFNPLSGLAILADLASVRVYATKDVTFTVIAHGTGLSYEWQTCPSGDGVTWETMAGYTGNTITLPAANIASSTGFRCVVTDQSGATVTSKHAYVSITPALDLTGPLESKQTYEVRANGSLYVFFTPTESGMYVFHHDYTGNTGFTSIEWDEETYYGKSGRATNMMLEAGREYVFEVQNYNSTNITADFWFSRPITLTEGQIHETTLKPRGHVLYQFTPVEDGWYGVINVPTHSLRDSQGNEIQFNEEKKLYWLEAGETYYLTAGGNSYGADIVFPIMISRPVQLNLNEPVSGTLCFNMTYFQYYFTVDKSGYYHLELDHSNVYKEISDEAGGYADGYEDDIYWLEAGVQYHVRLGANYSEVSSFTLALKSLDVLELGVEVPLDNTYNTAWYHFTPTKTGIYTFSNMGGINILCDDPEYSYIANFSCGSRSVCAAYLEAGKEYTIRYEFTYISGASTCVNYVDQVLAMDTPQQFTCEAGGYYAAIVNIDTAGYYEITTTGSDSFTNIILVDTVPGVEELLSWGSGDSQSNTKVVYLEAGQYFVWNNFYFAAADVTIQLREAVDPDSISFSDQVFYLGEDAGIYMNIDPHCSSRDFTCTISDPSVLEFVSFNEWYCNVKALSVGTVTVTITAANGVSCTATIAVKESIPLTLGQSQTVTTTLNQEEKLTFQVPADGYYCVMVSDASSHYAYLNGEANWVGEKTVEDVRYMYFYLMKDYEYQFVLWNWEENAPENGAVTVELKACAMPTSISLPETMTIYLNSSDYLEVDFGDLLTYNQLEWTLEGNAASQSSCDMNSLRLHGAQLGTTTVTVTTNDGTLSATCVVTVTDGIPVELDETVTLEVESGETHRLAFTPTQSGYYVIRYGECDLTIYDQNDNWIDFDHGVNCAILYLEAGIKYIARVSNHSTENKSVDVSISEPDALLQDQVVNADFVSYRYTAFQFVPETTGYYYLRVWDQYLDGEIASWDQSELNVMYRQLDDDYDYIIAKLEAGKKYLIRVCNDGWSDMNKDISVHACPVPDEVYLNADSTVVSAGDNVYVYFSWNPVIGIEDFTITSSDESVLALDEIYYANNWCSFIARKAGTVTVTIKTTSGLEDSVTIEVVEPVELTLGETQNVTMSGGQSSFIHIEAEEDGYYVFAHSSDGECNVLSMQRSMSGGNSYYDEENNICYHYYYLEAGNQTQIQLTNDSTESVAVDLLVKKASTPVSATLPETVTGLVDCGQTVRLTYGSYWEYGQFNWHMEGDAASIVNAQNGYCEIYCVRKGTAVLTATSADGTVVATCQIVVEDSLPIQVGQANVVTLPFATTMSFSFTPAQSGYYRIYFVNDDGGDIYWNLCAQNDDSLADVDSVYFDVYALEAGQEYRLEAWQSFVDEMDAEVYIEVLPNLALNSTVEVTDDAAYYEVTVQETGWYWFSLDSNVYMESAYKDETGVSTAPYDWYTVENGRVYVVYMEAGQSYLCYFENNAETAIGQITFTKSELPTRFGLWYNSTTLSVGGTTWVEGEFAGYCRCNITVSFSEEGIVELTQVEGTRHIFTGLKAGVVTVTFTTENGLSDSVTLKVVEPTILTGGTLTETTFEPEQTKYFQFTADSSGYYVLYLSNTDLDYEFSCNIGWNSYGMVTDENGGAYRYYWLDEGAVCDWRLMNYDSEKTVTGSVMVKKADEPTALTLPERIQINQGCNLALVAAFGSYWEFAYPYWGYSGEDLEIRDDGLYCDVRSYGSEGGTVTLTYYDSQGNAHTASCQVEIVEPETLTIGQVKNYQVSDGSSISFYIKPETDGQYFISCNDDFSLYRITADGEEWVDWDSVADQHAYYLYGGSTYYIKIWHYGSDTTESSIRVYQPEELILDTSVDFELNENSTNLYFFTPTESRMYAFRITDGDFDIDFYENNGWYGDGNPVYREGQRIIHIYLEADTLYAVAINTYDNAHAGTLTVEQSNAPQNFWVNCGDVFVEDETFYAWYKFDPGEHKEAVSVYIADPTIIEILEQTDEYTSFRTLKPGATEVVFTCESGYVRSLTITVADPIDVELVLDQPFTRVLNKGDVLYLKFDVSKYGAGSYVLQCSDDRVEINRGYWDESAHVDDKSYYFFYHEGDGYVEYFLTWQEESAEVTFCMTHPAKPEKIKLSETEIVLTEDSWYWLEMAFSPVLSWDGQVTWTSSDENVVKVVDESLGHASVYTVGEGTATITVTSSNGVTASCTVTVKNPTLQGQLTLNEYLTHEMQSAGEYALYTFTAPAAGTYFFACMSDVDSFLELMDADREVIAENDDYMNLHSGIWFQMEEGQTVYVQGRALDASQVADLTLIVSTHEDVYDEFEYAPYLSYRELCWFGDAWYEDGENDFQSNFSMTIYEQMWVIFYINYVDEDGQWVRKPVNISTNEHLTAETLASLGEPVGGSNGAYYYRISASEWDTLGVISYEFDGQLVKMEIPVERRPGGFYSEQTIMNDTYLHEFKWDPYSDGERVFYFAFDERMSHVEIIDCEAKEGASCVTLEILDGNMVKITVNADVQYEFSLELCLTLYDVHNSTEECFYGIYCYPDMSVHNHSYTSVVTAPTCTEDGYTTHTCACGVSYVSDTVTTKGHTEGQIVKENVEDGSYDEVVYCTVCGEELSRTKVNTIILGDLNNDGNVDILDANLAAAYYNERIDFTDEQIAAADVNADGNVDILDANLIAAYYNERIDKFPAEK